MIVALGAEERKPQLIKACITADEFAQAGSPVTLQYAARTGQHEILRCVPLLFVHNVFVHGDKPPTVTEIDSVKGQYSVVLLPPVACPLHCLTEQDIKKDTAITTVPRLRSMLIVRVCCYCFCLGFAASRKSKILRTTGLSIYISTKSIVL